MPENNVVLILTDTQPKRMVGCYGEDICQTPNLDRLAAEGVRFDRTYCATPLCTPARNAIFSGLHPIVGGAWGNEMTPARKRPLMGEVLQQAGIRAGYTGKWHLDGGGYHGAGLPDGGFEPDWWYDGKNYKEEIGQDRHRELVHALTNGTTPKIGITPELGALMREHDAAAALRAVKCRDEEIWGHRVADHAIDFLERVGDDRFVLVVSFDEPHGPFVMPPEFAGRYSVEDIAPPPNYAAPLDGKPALQQQQAREFPVGDWQDFCAWRLRHIRCNEYIDTQIGRVINAVDRLHADDTTIIYTSDHGDMMGAHGLLSKGAMMYEECAAVPMMIRQPNGLHGKTCPTVVSHLDLMPTVLDLLGMEQGARPDVQHGQSLLPMLAGECTDDPGRAFVSFNRFDIYNDRYGEFYPIRCVVEGQYKLAINLFDRDELYDLQADPLELTNRIEDSALAKVRDRLHQAILAEMHRTHDPLRGAAWTDRPWSQKREPYFYRD